MTRYYTFQRDLYATKGSGLTSEVYWIGDVRENSLIALVNGASTSTQTVQVSNADGRSAAIPAGSWSAHSLVVDASAAKYITDIPAGTRWVRAIRAESNCSLHVSGQNFA